MNLLSETRRVAAFVLLGSALAATTQAQSLSGPQLGGVRLPSSSIEVLRLMEAQRSAHTSRAGQSSVPSGQGSPTDTRQQQMMRMMASEQFDLASAALRLNLHQTEEGRAALALAAVRALGDLAQRKAMASVSDEQIQQEYSALLSRGPSRSVAVRQLVFQDEGAARQAIDLLRSGAAKFEDLYSAAQAAARSPSGSLAVFAGQGQPTLPGQDPLALWSARSTPGAIYPQVYTESAPGRFAVLELLSSSELAIPPLEQIRPMLQAIAARKMLGIEGKPAAPQR